MLSSLHREEAVRAALSEPAARTDAKKAEASRAYLAAILAQPAPAVAADLAAQLERSWPPHGSLMPSQWQFNGALMAA